MPSLLKKLHCEMVELTIRFAANEFKVSEFRKDVGGSRNQTEFSFVYGSQTKTRNEHAHLFLGLGKQQSIVSITYHPERIPKPNVREPYLEGILTWIGSFLKTTKVLGRFMVAFSYGKDYDSVVPLDYPLLINNKWFKNTTIVGHEISFPKGADIERAIISKKEGSFTVLISSSKSLELTDFDLDKAVKTFSVFASALVKRKEEANGK